MLLNHQDDHSQLFEYISFMDSMLSHCHITRKDENLTQDGKNSNNQIFPNENNDYGCRTFNLDEQLQNISKEQTMDERDSREAQRFEEFIEEETIRQDLKHRWKYQMKDKKKIERPKFIERHSAPLQAFTYHGITLNAKYRDCHKQKATAIAIPFHEAKATEFQRIFNRNPISFYFLKKLQRIQLQVGSLKCYSIEKVNKLNNHKWVYFFKKPQKSCLKEVSQFYLGMMLKGVLDTSIQYKNQSIVIPFFEWPQLSCSETAVQIFSNITNYLSKKVREEKISLKQIIICSDNPTDYLSLSNELKKISDEYVKCRSVAL